MSLKNVQTLQVTEYEKREVNSVRCEDTVKSVGFQE